jgi:hypothetical protein
MPAIERNALSHAAAAIGIPESDDAEQKQQQKQQLLDMASGDQSAASNEVDLLGLGDILFGTPVPPTIAAAPAQQHNNGLKISVYLLDDNLTFFFLLRLAWV